MKGFFVLLFATVLLHALCYGAVWLSVRRRVFWHFCWVDWGVFMLVSFIGVRYIFPEPTGECCLDERNLYFMDLALVPTHHIFGATALVWGIIKGIKR
jgi:hypothetical protein